MELKKETVIKISDELEKDATVRNFRTVQKGGNRDVSREL